MSLTGTTGERSELPPELGEMVERVRGGRERARRGRIRHLDAASRRARWREIADGVIVGSRIVRAAGEGGPEAVRAAVGELAAALA